eukprot:1751001-Alexandrium_andersonii.AAC.1
MWDRKFLKLETAVSESRTPYQVVTSPGVLYAQMLLDIRGMQGVRALPGMAPRGDLEIQIQ